MSSAIQPVACERYGDQFMALVNLDLYDDRFGLHWDNLSFLSSVQPYW
jgi:CRISPR-associated endonuclease/helicase Cas3